MFLKFDSMVSKQFYPRQKSVEKGDEMKKMEKCILMDHPVFIRVDRICMSFWQSPVLLEITFALISRKNRKGEASSGLFMHTAHHMKSY